MDDLLALMEDDPSEEPEQKYVVRDAPRRSSSEGARVPSAPKPAVKSNNSPYPSRPPPPSHASRAEASVDSRLGIRMLKRKMGSIDLIDLMASHPYHSPATLVKMPSSYMNQLLQDPSPVIDVATVIGQTNLLTIGVVFTNTGTRISKNGRAFSILGIGNLLTGPVVTVFLFGDAYSKHCKACVPGTVMALLNPSIIPPKDNSKEPNSLSLSVRDVRQLLPVAQARDYGVCKGVSKAKRPDGRLNEYHCKSHVDTRDGPYCKKHAKQGNVKNGKTVHDQTFLQKLKQELPRTSTGSNLFTNQSTPAFPNAAKQPKNVLLSKAPMHMVKGQRPQIQTKIFNQGESAVRKNPYQMKPQVAAKSAAPVPRQPMGQRIKGDWLNGGKDSTNNNKPKTKKRALNFDGGGKFNGTVMVPKPHKLFRATTNAGLQQAQAESGAGVTAEERARAIVDRQKSLLQVFRDKSNAPSTGSKLLQKARAKKAAAAKSKNSNAFFADMDIDVNSVLNAKSRFEIEAKAEEYARSRKLVADLATKEEREMKREEKNNKKGNQAGGKVQREWHCHNCQRTSGVEPKICKRQGHKVKFTRSIEETKTLTERRLQLQDKKVEDGGIKLGAGVEWTKYDRN